MKFIRKTSCSLTAHLTSFHLDGFPFRHQPEWYGLLVYRRGEGLSRRRAPTSETAAPFITFSLQFIVFFSFRYQPERYGLYWEKKRGLLKKKESHERAQSFCVPSLSHRMMFTWFVVTHRAGLSSCRSFSPSGCTQ